MLKILLLITEQQHLTSSELSYCPSRPKLGDALYTVPGYNFTAIILQIWGVIFDDGPQSKFLSFAAHSFPYKKPLRTFFMWWKHNFDSISTAWVINLSHSPLPSPQGIISPGFRIPLYFAVSKHCLFEHSKATSCHESVYWASQPAPAAPTCDWSPAECSIKCLSLHYLQIFNKKWKILQKSLWVIISAEYFGQKCIKPRKGSFHSEEKSFCSTIVAKRP